MLRPKSIVNFERCYLGGLAIGALNSALSWSRMNEMPQVRQSVEAMGAWYLPTVTILGLLIPLLLWYFTARRASTVAKWIIVVFFVFGVFGLLLGFGMGTIPPGLPGVLTIVAFVLNAVAVYLLFRPDAKRWFGGADDDYADTFA